MSTEIGFILLFVLNLLIFIRFNKIASFFKIYDHPDEKRKLHKKATPILGGFIIYFSILYLFIYQSFSASEFQDIYLFENKNFFIFLTLIFFIYLYDDLKVLSPNYKLILQTLVILTYLILDRGAIISSLKFSFVESKITLGYFSLPFTVLCFIIFMNE